MNNTDTSPEIKWSWRLHDELPVPSLTALFLIAVALGLALHTHSRSSSHLGAELILLILSIGSLVSARLAKNYWLVYFSVLLVGTALYPFLTLLLGRPSFF